MDLKARLEFGLDTAREFSGRLFESFRTPGEWTHQVHSRANHPLWCAGHIGLMEDYLVGLVDPKRADPRPVFVERFSVGTLPTRDLADYPPVDEVLEYMRERRATLVDILRGLSEDDLETRTPPGTPEFLPDFGSVFWASAWHDGMHAGQVNVAFRALGFG